MFRASKKVIQSRYLPERSYLYYQYPHSEGRSIEFYFPLFENVEISENQKSNLGSYDLVGRAGSLYSYHGAKSREFNLKFYLTLPNILDYIKNVGFHSQFTDSFRFFGDSDKLKEQIKFFTSKLAFAGDPGQPTANSLRAGIKDPNTRNVDGGFKNSAGKGSSNFEEAKSKFYGLRDSELTEFEKLINAFSEGVTKLSSDIGNFSLVQLFTGSTTSTPEKNAIEYFILLLNVIRTSTLNNSKNTNLGPPKIYINHGTMYNNIPCVCSNYSVRLVSDAGYNLTTMTPQRVEISLSLMENRVGNFGSFEPFKLISGENIAGWEAVIQNRTMDPYNSTFGEFDKDVALYNEALATKTLNEQINEKINNNYKTAMDDYYLKSQSDPFLKPPVRPPLLPE